MKSFFRRARYEQDGQVLLWVALLLIVLLGAAGLAIDIGFALHAQRELQASADAAATAGAMDLPAATAVATANSYSGIPGGKNTFEDLTNVTMAPGYPMVKCLTTTKLTCDSPGNGNAVAVVEQATVPTFFARVFGVSSLDLKVNALASMRTGVPSPANVLLVVDTTASMSSPDNQCAVPGLSNPTRLDCAKDGVRTLLNALWPCSNSLVSCGPATNGNVAEPVQEVGMLVFPGISSPTYASYNYTSCQANNISNYLVPYSATTIYSIIPLSSDYRTSTTSGLNGGSSNLVKAVDWQNGAGCTSSKYGLQNPGGMETYFAGAINAAQSMFDALPSSREDMQNAMILLSDGDANSSHISNALKANQCSQAVAAAHAAAATGTSVYSIAYGATNSGCPSDGGAYTPCSTMRQIASSKGVIPDASKFYSDNANGCGSADHPSMISLSQILKQISYDFLTTRLLPFDTP